MTPVWAIQTLAEKTSSVARIKLKARNPTVNNAKEALVLHFWQQRSSTRSWNPSADIAAAFMMQHKIW